MIMSTGQMQAVAGSCDRSPWYPAAALPCGSSFSPRTTKHRYDTQMMACMSQCEEQYADCFSNNYAISHVISAAVPCFDLWMFQSLILHGHIRAEMLRYPQLHYPRSHPLLSHMAEFGIRIADIFYSILCMRFTKQDVRERGAVRLLKDARQAHQAATSTAYPSILPSTLPTMN